MGPHDAHKHDSKMANKPLSLYTPFIFDKWWLSIGLRGPLWSWLNDRWIYNYLCNQYLPALTLRVRILLRRCVLDTTLCDKVCQWLAASRWFYLGIPVSSTNKTDMHAILLKFSLNTITLTLCDQTLQQLKFPAYNKVFLIHAKCRWYDPSY